MSRGWASLTHYKIYLSHPGVLKVKYIKKKMLMVPGQANDDLRTFIMAFPASELFSPSFLKIPLYCKV